MRKTKRKAARFRSALRSVLMLIVICIGFNAFLPDENRFENRYSEPSESRQKLEDNTDRTDVETEWNLVLVNKWNPMPDDYDVELTKLTNGQFVDQRIYPALQEMFDAARSEGVYPIVASGYRTAEQQQRLMEETIADYKADGYSNKEAVRKAEAWVAVIGTSEHQLGIAIDINADRTRTTNEKVCEWLIRNSYKYGFIRRYPANKTKTTGVIDEPWHYRYVGIDTAKEIYIEGICLEEYLMNDMNKKGYN